MYVETVPNRGSPPAILLRESYRDGKTIRKRTLLNLSRWPAEHIEGLRGVLKGGVVIPAGQEAITVERSLPHGHVAAVLGTARAIGLDLLLGPKDRREPNRPRDLVMAMIVSRVIAPASKLATAKALDPATAASSLGVELGLSEVDESELYAALDWLHERQGAIEAALAKRHLKGGTLVLYDVSSSYVEGRCCPLAKRGYNRDGKKGKAQIVYGLLCAADGTRRDRGVRGQYRRSQDGRRSGRQAEEAFRVEPCRAGRRSRHDHAGAHRRGFAPRGARLDHGAARACAARTGWRRISANVAVRRSRHGGGDVARFPRRALDRLPQCRSGARARPQARGPAYRHRARSGQDRRSRQPQDPAFAWRGGNWPGRRRRHRQTQDGQTYRADDIGYASDLSPQGRPNR